MYSVLAERDRKIATLTENNTVLSRDNATLMENFAAVSRDKAMLMENFAAVSRDNEKKDKLIAELMRKMNLTELN